MTNLRKETDSLGVVEVPADKLWAAQTQRSLEHFSIGQDLERASIRPPGFAEAAAAEIMKVFNATDGEGLGLLATNGKELAAAIKKALDHTAGPTLIECTIDRNDCTKQLLEWGTRVAAANARPQQRT